MNPRLEHANIVVADVDATIAFLRTAFPEFVVRHDGLDSTGQRWVHVGTSETYVAVGAATDRADRVWAPYVGRPGVNHLGYEVDDIEALRARLGEAGYRDVTVPNNHPYRKRVYFLDDDGNDWEFVQYLSLNPAERNDYEMIDPQ